MEVDFDKCGGESEGGVFDLFFFFQAEDGIRDHCVTGVQTCALPIWYTSCSVCNDNTVVAYCSKLH